MPIKVIDPISQDSVVVQEIVSYGGYIYNWPSKYDGIYWPLTDEQNIRFNPKSGYIAFGNDFSKITPDEIDKVRKYLETNYDSETPPKSFEEKLNWLFKVYTARGCDIDFRIRFNRLMSYISREDQELSLTYRKKTIELEKNNLDRRDPDFSLAESYYIIGFYSKLLGKESDSNKYFLKLENFIWKTEEGNIDENGKAHLLKLVKKIRSNEYTDEYLGNEG